MNAELFAQVSYTNWNFFIKAQNSTQIDSLASFGIRLDASSDFDNAYDVPRPPRPPSGNYLEVYFPHSGGNYPPILGTKYASDYQGPPDPIWNFSVESSVTGTVTILWDSSYVAAIEARVQLYLLDISTGGMTNMRSEGRYVFSYTAKRDFRIIGTIKINLKYLMEGFWNGSSQIRDTISGYLAQSVFPFVIVDSAKCYLSSTGTGQLIFRNASTGNYYLVLRHRNHLEVWTPVSMSVTHGTTSITDYDFTTGPSAAYGTGALKQVGTVYVGWGGDVNQDGVIDFLDRNITWNNRGQDGQLLTDCNGDDTTDAADYQLVLDNRYKLIQKP
jgi:hypothetical protein